MCVFAGKIDGAPPLPPSDSAHPATPLTHPHNPHQNEKVYWRWLNRLVPATWVLYGLAGSQLAGRDDPLVYNGATTTVSAAMSSVFGIEKPFVPYTLAILAGHIVFVRVTSILALRYLNFLRR